VLSFSGFVPLKKWKIKGKKKTEKKRGNKFLKGKYKKTNGGVGGRGTKFNKSDIGQNNNNALMY
jgi:hypothetical protein